MQQRGLVMLRRKGREKSEVIREESEGERKEESRLVNGRAVPFYSQLGWFGLFS